MATYMTLPSNPGAIEVTAAEQHLDTVRASATNFGGGRTVNDMFLEEVGDIRRTETVLWQMISKRPANSPVIKQATRGTFPTVGAISGHDLSGASVSTPTDTALDITDPGQAIKAGGGVIKNSHLQESLARQQGYPFGNQFAQDTADLLTSTYRWLDKTLITGDAGTNALEFNGLLQQMPGGNVFTASVATVGAGTEISNALNKAVIQMGDANEDIMVRPTHILTSATGAWLLQSEWQNQIVYQNVGEIRPGVSIPGIMNGSVPIVQSSFIRDVDGGAGTDTVRYYLVDMRMLEWHGVMPMGGSTSPTEGLEVQLFDTTNYLNGELLVESRLALIYGTLFAKHQGAGIYRLDVTVPTGTTFSA